MGADASTLKKHLETASKTGALNLSDMKLKKLHDKVLQLSNLRTLDLSKNLLTEVPEPLGSMERMKQFNVAYNAIPQLPPALFAAWKSCEIINLSGNRLESIPQLDGMPRLKKLYLNGNALREIPESIAACVKLEVLEARQNQLATVPSGIGACRMLIELDLAQNQMVMLAPELAGCSKLTILDISGNAITAPAIPPNLLKTTSLARLFREGCPIEQRELEALDGFAEFAEREAAREAKKLDQRRGETGDVMFKVEQEGAGMSSNYQ